MSKSAVYTRTGDKGLTSLVGGQRVPKNSTRLEAYGNVDEFMSWLGVIATSGLCPAELAEDLRHIQNKLFNIGAYLATDPHDNTSEDTPSNFSEDDIKWIEEKIDSMDSSIPPIHAFILPGGSSLSAMTHVARTICRRSERRIISLAQHEKVSPLVIQYFNRLSDYLFIAAKFINASAGIPETVWNPEA